MTLNKRQEAKLLTKGRIHWFDQKTNIFYKLYKKENLLDSAKDLELRLSQIVKLSSSMEFIPEITYTFEEDLLIMRQDKLSKDNRLDKIEPFEKKLTLINQLAQSLDQMHAEGFVHGDINRKNIIYSDDRLWLIDFEPSLLQIKNHAKQWMSTRPYIHHDDMKSNTITIKSDLLGFGCFVNWLLIHSDLKPKLHRSESSIHPQDYAEVCSELINEHEFESNSFQKLVELILEKINFKAPVLSQEEIQMHIDNITSSFDDETNPYDYSRPADSLLDVAIYIDASPSGKTKDNQIYELFEICECNKWHVIGVYFESLSGLKDGDKKTDWNRMVNDASQKKFSKIVVWSLDTLTSFADNSSQMDDIDIFSYK